MASEASAVFAQMAADVIAALATAELTLPGGAVIPALVDGQPGQASLGGAPAGMRFNDAVYVVATSSITGIVKGSAITLDGATAMLVSERWPDDFPAPGQTQLSLEKA